MRRLRDFAVVTLLMAVGTWLLGWWTVPATAAIAALVHRRGRGAVVQSALAAALSWAILLAFQAFLGSSLLGFDRALALSLGVPESVPLALTLILPVLLAASAAGTVVGLKNLRHGPRAPAAT